MIKIMEKGMQKKVYMNKLIIESFLDKCRSILDDKISPKNVPKDLKTKFVKSINDHIIVNIKKLNNFVMNKYFVYCIDNIGLCAYSGGKRYYELICKQETLPNLTPDIIHQFGIKELKKDLALKKKLAKKIGCDDIDDYMYKHDKYYSSADEIMKDLEKQKKIMHSKLDKYFFQDIDKLYNVEPIAEYNMNMTAYYVGPNRGNKGVGTFFINIGKI